MRLQCRRIAGFVEELLSCGVGVPSDRATYIFGFAYATEHPGLAICTWCCSSSAPNDTHRIPSYPDPPPSLRLAMRRHSSCRVRQCNRERWKPWNARMGSLRGRTAFEGESRPTYSTRSPSVMLIHVAVVNKGCDDTSVSMSDRTSTIHDRPKP